MQFKSNKPKEPQRRHLEPEKRPCQRCQFLFERKDSLDGLHCRSCSAWLAVNHQQPINQKSQANILKQHVNESCIRYGIALIDVAFKLNYINEIQKAQLESINDGFRERMKY